MKLRLESLLHEAAAVPVWEWGALFGLLAALILYRVLDFHFFEDLCGLRGDIVRLYYNPSSKVAAELLAKCNILKSRYWLTPWLCSPHLQIAFLHFLGRAPTVNYFRKLFTTPDGGTIALDWVKSADRYHTTRDQFAASDETPIVVVIPGLTSDSTDAYIKHLVCMLSNHGWKSVVINHRGFGGVSITSDCFYNAGWTEDLRGILAHVHEEHPKAPLFAIGTSIGANILVKYLGEEGRNTPLHGATAICCPWDLVVCDRFIHRSQVQKVYNTVLTTGLRGYAQQHKAALSRMTDLELIDKCRTIREFDNYCTRLVGNYETVDTYYRRCSSVHFLEGVAVPLLCISSLDDPVCTKEAIPWDECSTNPFVILGVTRHGGHIAYYEGLTANSIWWVRSVTEFLDVLFSSSNDVQEKVKGSDVNLHVSSEIDKGPYLRMSESGKVSAEGPYSDSALRTPLIQAPVLEKPGDSNKHKNTDLHQTAENSEDIELMQHGTSTEARENESAASVIKLQLQSQAELLALRSALSQLMEQVQVSNFNLETSTLKEANVQCDPNPVPLSKPIVQPRALELYSVASSSRGFSETTMNLSQKENNLKLEKPFVLHPKGGPKKNSLAKNKLPISDYTGLILRSIKDLVAQNKWTFWLVAYVAIATTYPLFGSAFFIRLHQQVLRKNNK